MTPGKAHNTDEIARRWLIEKQRWSRSPSKCEERAFWAGTHYVARNAERSEKRRRLAERRCWRWMATAVSSLVVLFMLAASTVHFGWWDGRDARGRDFEQSVRMLRYAYPSEERRQSAATQLGRKVEEAIKVLSEARKDEGVVGKHAANALDRIHESIQEHR